MLTLDGLACYGAASEPRNLDCAFERMIRYNGWPLEIAFSFPGDSE